MFDNLEEIIRLAKDLGQAIRRHPRYALLRETDERVRADAAATKALDAYNQAAATLARKERAAQPISVDEKRHLDRLRQTVASNETVKAFMRAHADFAELLQRATDTMHGAMRPEERETAQPAEPVPAAETAPAEPPRPRAQTVSAEAPRPQEEPKP
jgi:cell fate (sporulation/competence/biofilm development) regulator YlbF (YheA/YmcA/DUF963 family)